MEIAGQTTRKDLEGKVLADLHELAAEAGIERYRLLNKAELIDRILESADDDGEAEGDQATQIDEEAPATAFEGEDSGEKEIPKPIKADEFWESEPEPVDEEEREQPRQREEETITGIIDLRQEGYGLLRVAGYLESRNDVYVSASQIRRFSLRRGDEVSGQPRNPRRGEKHPALRRVDLVNGVQAEDLKRKERFVNVEAVPATEEIKLKFARGKGKAFKDSIKITRGGRVLISCSAGADDCLSELADAIASGGSCDQVLALLLDVPPERAPLWSDIKGVDVIAATYDRPRKAQLQVAELALERSKRLVEEGKNVAVLVDSMTDVGRAYGSDLIALHRAKRFFGAGRCLAGGAGSLTLIATVRESDLLGDKAVGQELQSIATSSLGI